ncbi:polysaccharide biosynthesis protein [Hephaestia mangrovi]|uniref:polysaccharide biosynthesis protein n=1 Tax=Hephaestia mangrovi TaxID=2873268 RepID=UPI001CA6723C|nr:nucleoside-diphosphate sugar epimerase/dehydratase [Hephaestia mangrovi]MBY8828373.1 polysaccharide biosynthesis protein [Hephaestia mangrovi]
MATTQPETTEALPAGAGAARWFGGRDRLNALRLRPLVRLVAVGLLDALAIVASIKIAAAQTGSELAAVLARSGTFSTLFATIPVGLFIATGLYRRSWRFISYADALYLVTTVAAGLGAAWVAALVTLPGLRDQGATLLPFALVSGALALVAMAGLRGARRGLRVWRSNRRAAETAQPPRIRRALLLGDPEWALAMIELIRADRGAGIEIVGVLTPDGSDHRLQIAGIPVLGSPEMLGGIVAMLDRRGQRPACVLLRDDGADLPRRAFLRLVSLADQNDLVIARAGRPGGAVGHGGRFNLEYLPLADLLGRPEISLAREAVSKLVAGRRVLVTGAGGTIGGELVRQLAAFGPAEVTLLDHGEFNLYAIDMEVRERFPNVTFHAALCSVRQRDAVFEVFAERRPDVVFHAAALKHVPLVEANPCAGIHTNVIGTRNIADAVCTFGAAAMVQVSTDKAVNPVGMMGVTKRLGELYCQALDLVGGGEPDSPRFMTVRFGNVLGSSGSLIPLFQRQLAEGRPLTVTHPDIERFFMTVEEAVQLILTSSAHAFECDLERGTVFVLDMGEPVKIVDIAKRVIRLAGLEPGVDVPIRFIGLRPGEKLFEELFDASEDRLESRIPGIFEARPCPVPLPELVRGINELERLVHAGDAERLRVRAREMVEWSSSAPWRAAFHAMLEEAAAVPGDQTITLVESPPPGVTLQ